MGVHVSLCVLARQSACACEATPETARALLSRNSVALRPNQVGVGSPCASGACPLRVLQSSLRSTATTSRHSGRSWSRVRDRRRADDPWSSQRASEFAIPKQQLPMLRRALATPSQKARVSRVLHTTGWAAYNHVPVRCSNVSQCLVQLRDGLRATPSLDAGRGEAVLFPEQRVGSHDGLASADVTKVGASLRFLHR